MAESSAGDVYVKVIPDADRAAFSAEINKALGGIKANVEIGLKLKKGAAREVVAEANVQLDKAKSPTLSVNLKVGKGEAAKAIREANANFKALKQPPALRVGLTVTANDAKAAIRDANEKLKAAKVAPPKLKVQLDLNTNDLELIKQARVSVRQANAVLDTTPLLLDMDLDPKALARVNEKAQVAYAVVAAQIKARQELQKAAALSSVELENIEAAARQRRLGAIEADYLAEEKLAELHAAKLQRIALDREAGIDARVRESALKSQAALNQKLSAGLDQRSLEELRHINRTALAQTRADLQKRTSSNVTLRQLRNDLGQFDASTTRVLRNLSLGFGVFTGAVVASFAGITIASLKSFADTEQQLRRTAAVLGTGVFADVIAQTGDAKAAFAAFNKEVDRTNSELAKPINAVAVGTIFDPTEIAQATRALAQAGLKVNEIKSSLLGISQFAQNEEILPEEAVQNLVQGATAAGVSLSKITGLSDKFTFVANNTTASAKEVADAFSNRAAPAFRAYGESVSSTLTVLDLFAAAGIKGKTAGEQAGILIRFINQAATKTPATTAAFKKYGIEIGKVNGKQVPFLKTLAQTSVLLDKVGKEQGSLARTKLQAQLGLTQRSAAGLNQLLSQITKGTGDNADAAFAKLTKLQREIDKSAGSTARQASVITNTLSFQFDILSNNITTLFKQASGPLGRALTGVFKDLNGQVSVVNGQVVQTGGVLGGLTKRFNDIGEVLAKKIAPALQSFATGGEGKDFFEGIFEGYKGVLEGIVGSFRAFRNEAFGDQSGKGFFSILGSTFAGLGKFASVALPAIGSGLGKIVGFIRTNTDAVKLFLKSWLGLFVVSKALRLFLIPLVSVGDNLGFLKGAVEAVLGLNFVSKFAGAATNMANFASATADAARAAKVLAGTQVATDIASSGALAAAPASAGVKASGSAGQAALSGTAALAAPAVSKLGGGLKALLPDIKAIGPLLGKAFLSPLTLTAKYVKGIINLFKGIPSAIGAAANFIREIPLAFGVAKASGGGGIKGFITAFKILIPEIETGSKVFSKFLGPIGLVVLAIEAGIGAVKGFVAGFKEQLDTTGKGGEGLKALLKVLKVIADVLGIVGDAGKSLGKFFGRLVAQIINSLGQVILGLKELFSGNFIEGFKLIGVGLANALTAPLRFAVAFVIDLVGDLFNALGKVPGLGKFKDAAAAIHNAATEVANFKIKLDESTGSTKKAKDEIDLLGLSTKQQAAYSAQLATQSQIAGRISVLANQASKASADRLAEANAKSVVFITKTKDASTTLAGAVGGFQPLFKQFDSAGQTAFSRVSAAAASTTAVLLSEQAALQASLGQTANAYNSIIDANLQQALTNAQNGIGALSVKQVRAQIAAQGRFESDQKAIAAAKEARRQAGVVTDALGDSTAKLGTITDAAAEKTKKDTKAKAAVKTAAELATAAVEKLTAAQFRSTSDALIAKISKVGGSFKATAFQSAILAKAIPLVDAALQKQTDLVSKLDTALQNLQGTQLAGTKAASDVQFGFTQQENALNLQKVNLQLANPGITEEDPAIKAINDQLNTLQLQAQKAELEASAALDPLKKKLDDTFSPVKELSFDAIIAQFQKLSTAKTAADKNLASTTTLKAKLDEVAAASADKFSSVGLNVSKGIEAGLKAGNAALVGSTTKAANTVTNTARNTLGIHSPSTVFTTIGVQTMQGFSNGLVSQQAGIRTSTDLFAKQLRTILAADTFYIAAGEKVMRGFKTGLNNVYVGKDGVQDFVKEIAVWIKANKGPISYDAQLLRPAGEAIMSGFRGGLSDGFSEIKTWTKNVAPSIQSDMFPKELMFKRSAKFLLNNAKYDSSFDPNDAFGDLVVGGQFGPAAGAFGPLNSILHKTLSLADTIDMGQKLMAEFGLNNLTAKAGHNQFTSSGNESAHFIGQAVDMALAGVQVPEAHKDALFAALRPFAIGPDRLIEQLIYKDLNLHHGAPQGPVPGHFNHVHAQFAAGKGFAINSGKKGVSGLSLPGVPADVLNAISVVAQQYKFDPTVIAAVMKQESGFRKNIVSGDGGYGLMQLTSANLLKDADAIGGRLNPVANALVGTKYLRDLISQLGSLNLGLSAYNSGPGGGERSGHIDVPAYVSSVLRYLAEIRRQAGIGGARAQGGRTNANTPYLVGERGREIWVPEKNGSVITNKNVEALIDAMRSGGMSQAAQGAQQVWAPQISVASNSTDAVTVANLVAAKLRAQVTGVRR